MKIGTQMKNAAKALSSSVSELKFTEPVTFVYNPLDYAWSCHQKYLDRFATSTKKVIFLGMNPGPWGMAQTGIPFGEIPAVRDWMKITGEVKSPEAEHPKRPIEGIQCTRSEVSGRRLWGLFAEKFGDPDNFFEDHFVLNYCPLVFMEESGKNRTPDKLPVHERELLDQICDIHLTKVVEILQPEWLVGVGAFAESKLIAITEKMAAPSKVIRILHPSPASPAANRDWSGTAQKQLNDAGVW
tara:strand:+ start:174 stop:899 length:726 start_codon:yes stop_codon:yes gene_type:complete